MTTLLKNAIHSYASGVAAITSVVSTRIYAGMAPSGAALPYIVFTRVGSDHPQNQSGPSDIAKETIQFSAFAATSAQAEDAAEALRAAFDGYVGKIMGTSPRTVEIRRVLLVDRNDSDPIALAGGSERFKFAVHSTFDFWYVVDVPSP